MEFQKDRFSTNWQNRTGFNENQPTSRRFCEPAPKSTYKELAQPSFLKRDSHSDVASGYLPSLSALLFSCKFSIIIRPISTSLGTHICCIATHFDEERHCSTVSLEAKL
jgi:hypothetical protein